MMFRVMMKWEASPKGGAIFTKKSERNHPLAKSQTNNDNENSQSVMQR